ncbi:unnamed protein product, partial [Pleuronectes platessa]
SPEIMLGHPFTEAIDMWSLDCIAAAMYLGALLYPGLGEYEMIRYIMETQGQLPDTMLNHGCKTPQFFKRNVDSTTSVWKLKTPEEYHKETGKQPMENRFWKFTSLDGLLHTRPISNPNSADKIAEMADARMFVDMLKAMLPNPLIDYISELDGLILQEDIIFLGQEFLIPPRVGSVSLN